MTSATIKQALASPNRSDIERGQSTVTPRLLFSLNRVRDNAEVFRALCERVFRPDGYEIYFPTKVAPSLQIVNCLRELGFGLEVINHSTAAMAHADPLTRTILGGPAKTSALIAWGFIQRNWTYVSCESLTDLREVNAVAAHHKSRVSVFLRVKATTKRRLGMSIEDARWSVTHSDLFPALKLAGIHLHAGSNLSSREADLTLERMRMVAVDLAQNGMHIEVLNFGGGLPCIAASVAETERRLQGFSQLADTVGTRVIVEPGRAIVGDAAELITEVTDVRPVDRELTINSAAYIIHGPCNADKFIIHQRLGEVERRRIEVVARKEANYRIGGIWPAEGDSLWLSTPTPEFAIGDRIIFPQAGAYTLGFLNELSFDELLPTISS
ncbi:hypothetical protein [Rhizobium leguminosarum]|uniref:hypothetical protein n=1 Tax=Rhizobium leguminosarum TaxID=384 RepID=UPI0013DA60C1|nr:hypothetical protein [Rhizobium leguminosarum]